MSINKEEATFIITLWINTVFEVIDIVEDKQQICTLLQRCKYVKTLLNKLKEV